MSMSPALLLHICSGTVGVLSGYVAVTMRKGSRRHSIAGLVFVISMLSLGATGAYMAVLKSQVTNVLGGALTFYLVSTAWLTARHHDGRTRIFDWAALMAIFSVAAVEITFGVQAVMSPSGQRYGYPAAIFFVFGSVAILAFIGDIRMLFRRGIFGVQRISRHLWRMCFALFIAASSIFMARPQLFPAFMQKFGILAILSFLPLALMIFWLIRVRFTRHGTNAASRKLREQTHPASESLLHA